MIDHGDTRGSRKAPPADAAQAREPATRPDWATGLKQFYDSVVDEPLPDDLAALLAKLDGGSDD